MNFYASDDTIHPSSDPIVRERLPVETYQGFEIFVEDGDGFYWQEDGYFASIDECRRDIADWNEQEAARDAA